MAIIELVDKDPQAKKVDLKKKVETSPKETKEPKTEDKDKKAKSKK